MGFHIVKRENCPFWKKILFYLLSIAIALAIGGGILWAIGVNPYYYFMRMFTLGIPTNRYPHRVYMNFLNRWVPLVLTSLGLSLAFKMRFWNIGGEGQFIAGAMASTAIALKYSGQLSTPMLLVCMCLAGMLAAGILGLIVAALKVKFGTNETLLTLMINYIALYFIKYVVETKADWNFFLNPKIPRATAQTLPKNAIFPSYAIGPKFKLSLCVILVFVIAVLVYIYLKHTKHGYEIGVVGDSPGTARYAGMKTGWITLRTVFLSACLIGLAASFKVGINTTLSVSITGDVGWTGIVVAWLAQLNTWAILLVSALINLLHYGSEIAATLYQQVDVNFANMLQGFLLFWVLAADFMIRFKIVRTKKSIVEAAPQAVLTEETEQEAQDNG